MNTKTVIVLVDIFLVISWAYIYFFIKKKELSKEVCIGIVINFILLISFYVFLPTEKENYHNSKDHNSEHRLLKRAATTVHRDKDTQVYIIDNFLTQDECDQIINSAQGKMTPSPLSRKIDDESYRDSETCYFEGTPAQTHVNQKICDIIGIDNNMSEPPQIQHYNLGNQFKAHCDYFHKGLDYEEFAGDNANYQGQRTWTFMVFLNNVEKGGETEFINLNNLYITPKKGTAVVWSNLKKDGTVNDQTLHRGTPILLGEKYIITKWFREKWQK